MHLREDFGRFIVELLLHGCLCDDPKVDGVEISDDVEGNELSNDVHGVIGRDDVHVVEDLTVEADDELHESDESYETIGFELILVIERMLDHSQALLLVVGD